MIHVVLIIFGKIIIDIIPGMTQQISWTLVNLFYLAVRCLSSSFKDLTQPMSAVLPNVPLGHRYTI